MSLDVPPHASAGPPAGWYPDPHNGHQQRWWDGRGWTDHVAPAAQVTVHVNQGPPSPPGQPVWGPSVRPTPTVPIDQLATAGQRLLAVLVDMGVVAAFWVVAFGIAIFVGNVIPGGEALSGLLVVGIWVASAAYGIAYTATCGQTYGKHLLGIEIRRVDDGQNAIGVGAALGREIVKGIGSYFLALGLLWILFDPQRQGWHDRAVRTVVVTTDQPRVRIDEFLLRLFRR